ncbi:MAG: geranylgeranyl reductase family protein [Chloroflexi bacterium]|nr:geranylgeranyl reductase family protein [Chloroflexota bacterium]
MYDVVVVGAGPAGSTAARRCTLLGLKTLLIEKTTLPRYKACGGGVPTPALSYLDFPLDPDLIEGELFGVRVRYGRHFVDVRRPYRLGICTSRDKFDAFLTLKAVEAGVELHDEERVTSVENSGSHAVVQCNNRTYQARIVIGADGAYSVVAKKVRPPFKREGVGIACDVNLPTHEISVDDPQLAVFDFGAIRHGYGWIFPREEYIGVGIGARASKLSDPRKSLRQFLSGLGVERDDIKSHWHALPAGGYQRKTIAGRVMLVGDAAGYVDPLFGGGIEMAVRSGIFAAETAGEAIASNDCSENALRSYQQRCDSTFGKWLRLALLLSLVFHRYPDVLIKPFAMDASLTQWLVDSIFGHTEEENSFASRWLMAKVPLLILRAAASA